MDPPGAGAAPIGGAVLAGPVRRRRTGSRASLPVRSMTFPSVVLPRSRLRGRKGEGTAAELRTQMRRSETTTIPEGEPTVRLGPDRVAGRVVLDRYRLDERLGAGGFGVVWRAHDLKLERDVAVKAVPRTGGEAETGRCVGHRQSRTEREALAAARLNHPGIVALYEFGYDDEDIYLVSELVEGATLGELTAGGVLSDRDVARIGQALGEALQHAHARGVIHRDVKPANVMVLAEPAAGAGFAKLTDLGVAHVASADDLTATGDVVGTLAYMAPEQAEGQRVTAACDVYSLALTLYEAWTGHQPGPCPRRGRHRAARGHGAAAAAVDARGPARRPGRGGGRRAGPRPRVPAGSRRAGRGAGRGGRRPLRRGRPGRARDDRALRPDRRPRPHPADDVAAPRQHRRGARARWSRSLPSRRGAPGRPGWGPGWPPALLAVAGFADAGLQRRPSRRCAAAAVVAVAVARAPAAGLAGRARPAFCLWLATAGGEPGSALVLAAGPGRHAAAAAPRRRPVVAARAGAAAGRGGPRADVRGPGRAGHHRLAARRAGRRGLRVAGRGRGAERAATCCSASPTARWPRPLGGFGHCRPERRASGRWCPPPRWPPPWCGPRSRWLLPLVARGRWAAVDLLAAARPGRSGLVVAHDWLGRPDVRPPRASDRAAAPWRARRWAPWWP